MGAFDLVRFSTSDELAADAARRWLDVVDAARHADALHHVALPGGRIVRSFFDRLVEEVRRRNLSLAHVHFFWGDERCVPPEDAESNFGLAWKHLLGPLDVPTRNTHRIKGELAPEIAARDAEAEVRRLVPPDANGWPAFDLVLLGMGEDGHVASLFPGSESSRAESGAAYLSVVGPKPPPRRISLCYGALAVARRVWVLASGAGKEQALKESLAAQGRTPLARLVNKRSHTEILTDIQSA